MKKTNLKYILSSVGFSALFACSVLQANEFSLYAGLGYSSSGTDAADFYESNFTVETKGLPGFGVSFRVAYNMDNNIRIDIGTGNVVYITGDLNYYSVPFNITGGYNYHVSDDFNVYTRAGVIYRVVDGDYVINEDKVGALLAVGLEYGSFFMELSADSLTSEFSITRHSSGLSTTSSQTVDGGFNFTLGGFF